MNHDDDIRRATTMADEAEVRTLLAPRRPDPARFSRGVAQRLADGERSAAPPVARAASRLPFDVTPLAGGSSTLLSSPVLLLSLAGAAFLAALQGLRRTLATSARRETNVSIDLGAGVALRFGIWIFALLCSIVRCFVDATWAGDLLLLLLVGSSFLMVLAVRRSARRTGIDRATVATITTTALEAVLVASILFAPAYSAEQPHWQWRVFAVLGAAVLAILPAAPRAAFGALWTLAVFGLLHSVLADRRELEPDLDAVATAVSTAEPSPLLTEAIEVATLAAALRDHGRTVELSEAYHRALGTARESGRLAPLSLTAELRMQRIDASEWRRLAAFDAHPITLDRLRRGTTPLRPYDFNEYEIAMLVASGELDAADTRRLADRLLAGLDGAPLPLRATAIAARWLDHLGRGDVVDEQSPAWHELLVRHHHRAEPGAGGFRAMLDAPGPDRGATHDAVSLMARIGVPDGVDARALRRHLALEYRFFTALAPAASRHLLIAYTDRLTLDRLVGVPRRTLLEVLHDERAFLAMLAFALVCLFAVWSAPEPRAPSPGAMP